MNKSEYMDLFIEETREHLQFLNEGLLQIEKKPDDDGPINEIFRAAHTIKGMAATMGFEQITEITHKMENLLVKIREKDLVLSTAISDVLFGCVDTLEQMLENIIQGQKKEIDISYLITQLNNFENPVHISKIATINESINNSWNELNEYEHTLIVEAQKQNLNIYRFSINVSSDCVMKSVRVFMVFKSLEGIGEIIKSVPSSQDLEDEKFDNEFTVYFVSSKDKENIRKIINQISEISLENLEVYSYENTENTEKTAGGLEQEESNETTNYVKTKIHQTVRVDINKLDNLMNLVGELVINKTRLEQIFRTNDVASLNETVEQIDRITTDLQNVVMNVRMVPIEQVFNRFPRMVRDLSKELGKEVNLSLEGKETELDRTVIDEIGDPLVHLLRNAIDHGIENPEIRSGKGKNKAGTIRLIARQEGNSVVIIVQDDGQGISLNKIKEKSLEKGVVTNKELEQMDQNSILNLIFSPGFSTASTITDVSGRGVGLDVVKSKIQALSGNVYVENKEGEGTKFTIKLPLTLAIIQALLVKLGTEIYAVPLANIDETTGITDDLIKNIQGQEVMVLRGKVLPLVRLSEIFEAGGSEKPDEIYVVVVRKGEKQIGLVVNELIGQQEIVITSLGKLLSGIPGIAGAAILGDGKVSLILDVGTLF
ncbi:MAG: chemotaxis protein CheA [Peptococcaceae bacterium BICA1-8]|nr:MAG: chemotaxis protein CheA [Peptococcaceae bacterium BICA1-8]